MTAGLAELALEPWEATKNTLHLYAQVVGKVRLASAPARNHWWHAALYVDVRGLTTRLLRRGGVRFEIAFDFVDHRLVIRTTDGRALGFELTDGLSVAAFDARVHELLGALDVDVELVEVPFGVPMTTPFPEDREHASYDRRAVERFWRALLWTDDVLSEFAGWFCGKTSPVHLFWHSLDLAVTRFSGRIAPAVDGADPVTREAYSHELISFGFWAGDRDLREPAFYSYTAPEPAGIRDSKLRPSAARWLERPTGSLALLPYETVRTADDPRKALLAFLQSAYDAGARAAGWNRDALVSTFCPPPADLARILAA